MSYTNGLDKPTDYFNTLTWTGDGSSSRNITGLDFQPDWVWVKCRNAAVSHAVYDSVRGASKLINTNTTSAEGTNAAVNAFISDGFTVNSDSYVNLSSNTYVGWNWLADNTTGSSNTDGSITSSVSANTTSGFSIVSYTGTGSASTIGHSLGVAPKVVLVKNRDGIDVWVMQHGSLADNEFIEFNGTAGKQTDSARFNGTAPTSTVFSVGTSGTTNGNTEKFIAYCFAEKKGFSRFGSYVGNGSSDGSYIHLGFKPAMIITKKISASGDNWQIRDNKRDTFNEANHLLKPNASTAEATTDAMDYLSNGFKWRNSAGEVNASGATYIFMAFAENPFVTSTGIPTTAR